MTKIPLLIKIPLSKIPLFKKIMNHGRKPSNPHPMPGKPVNPVFNFEAEKQDLIWKAFGVDHSRELRQLGEARERFLLQLKTNLMTDDVKNLIEDIVRDEVRRVLRKNGAEYGKNRGRRV